MDIDDLRLLRAVGETGSLSAVAKVRGVAVSTIARRLDGLEARLNLRLLDRRTNGAGLTPDGERIAALALSAIESGERIARAAAAMRAGGDQPPVVVSATEIVISEILAPALATLWSRHPGVRITLHSQAGLVSLSAREADLAVRMSRPEGASLIAKKLPTLGLGLFASAGYLAGREPKALRLADERLLFYDDSYGPVPELAWIDAAGLGSAVVLRTGSTRALLAAAEAGAGIALLPAIFARRKKLVEVPAPATLPSRTPWLIAHRELRRVPTIALVHKWIAGTFAALPDPKA